jgi:hypothetical protein
MVAPIHSDIQADSATTQYNNNYGGGYGQSNPYDNAPTPPPGYGMLDLARLL